MRKLLHILAISAFIAFTSCMNDEPSGLLSASKMEDILYDYNISQGIVTDGTYEEENVKHEAYRLAVLKKHGVTEAEWDSSFNYYCRHTEELYDIYTNVSNRIQSDILAYGGEADFGEDGMASMGDTANVWKQETSLVLMHLVPYNIYSYSLEADTSYHAGDKFVMSYDVKFVFQDGMRDIVTVLSATLQNDSVISHVAHTSTDGKVSVTISDDKRKGIKSLRGYILVSQNISESTKPALRMVSISGMKLIRMHTEQKAIEERNQRDSIDVSKQDSIKNIETENNTQPITTPIEHEKATLQRPVRHIQPMRVSTR